MLVAAAVLSVGLIFSAAAAVMWRSTQRDAERQQFRSTASDVTESLATLRRRNTTSSARCARC
jgi:hypothetical protein